MALRSTNERWGWVTRALHWSIALTVFGMIAAGLYAVSLDTSTRAGEMNYYSVIDVHKSFGLLIIALMAFRLLWRVGERSPWPTAETPALEIVAARGAQVLLYAGLFVMPVSGYLWATAYGEPARFFGVKLPGFVHFKGEQAKLVHHIHIITAFVLMTIIGLHILGALKNHFIDRNDVLRKMLGLAPRRIETAP
ncbi:MAG: cytochrome b [Sphingomonadaceae bacterium]|nr:cytochrome b [Sphingomonadaceae bacterium]